MEENKNREEKRQAIYDKYVAVANETAIQREAYEQAKGDISLAIDIMNKLKDKATTNKENHS